MKKFLFFLLLFIPTIVNAEDLVLKNLQIKNGELSLPFDPYNTEYTVTLKESDFKIDFDYVADQDITVAIDNNTDLENDSVVTLTILKENEKLDYHFHVLKNSDETIKVFTTPKVEEKESFMFKYKQYVIPSGCLFLIFLIFKILFVRKKHKSQII